MSTPAPYIVTMMRPCQRCQARWISLDALLCLLCRRENATR